MNARVRTATEKIQSSSSRCVCSFQTFLFSSSLSVLTRSDLFGSFSGMMKYSSIVPSSHSSVSFVFLSANFSVSGLRYLHVAKDPRERSVLSSSVPDLPFVRTSSEKSIWIRKCRSRFYWVKSYCFDDTHLGCLWRSAMKKPASCLCG